MLQRFRLNDSQYIKDLADAGILTDAQKQVYLERLRISRERAMTKARQLEALAAAASAKNSESEKVQKNPKENETTTPAPVETV